MLQYKNISVFILVAFLAAFVTGCSHSVRSTLAEQSRTPKAVDCELEIFEQDAEISEQAEGIGEMSIGDTGFSVACGYDVMMKLIRENACKAGADAVYVYDVRSPDILSTCWRGKAKFYAYTEAPSVLAQSNENPGKARGPRTEQEAVLHFFDDRKLDLVEGIWTWGDNTYQVAIVRNDTGIEEQYDYIGIIIRADSGRWQPGQVKLLLNSTASSSIFTGVYFAGNQTRNNTSFLMEDRNLIKVNLRSSDGQPLLIRDYPVNIDQAKLHQPDHESQGTCFNVTPNGLAITSHHVVDGAESISVSLSDGRVVPAEVEVSSAANDIAILRLATFTPNFLSLRSTRTARLGEKVFTVGFPSKSILGSEPKFTEGSISAFSGIQGDATYMQVSIPIQPGNSGGPVVDHRGNVVGVIAATAAIENFYNATGSLPQNVNWAVKSDYILPMLDERPERAEAQDRDDAISRVELAVCQVIASH